MQLDAPVALPYWLRYTLSSTDLTQEGTARFVSELKSPAGQALLCLKLLIIDEIGYVPVNRPRGAPILPADRLPGRARIPDRDQ
jgi:hypothetical protein